MPVEFWTGGPFDQTHERIAQKQLELLLSKHFAGCADQIVVAFNIAAQKADLDVLILKHDSVIIVDFKECGSPVHATENGAWQIKGGGSLPLNPFRQVKKFRHALSHYLFEHRSEFLRKQKAQGLTDPKEFLNFIRCVIAMSPRLHPESTNDLDFARPWFHLTGLDVLPQLVENITATNFSLDASELDGLIRLFHCDPLHPRSAPSESSGTIGAIQNQVPRQPEQVPPSPAQPDLPMQSEASSEKALGSNNPIGSHETQAPGRPKEPASPSPTQQDLPQSPDVALRKEDRQHSKWAQLAYVLLAAILMASVGAVTWRTMRQPPRAITNTEPQADEKQLGLRGKDEAVVTRGGPKNLPSESPHRLSSQSPARRPQPAKFVGSPEPSRSEISALAPHSKEDEFRALISTNLSLSATQPNVALLIDSPGPESGHSIADALQGYLAGDNKLRFIGNVASVGPLKAAGFFEDLYGGNARLLREAAQLSGVDYILVGKALVSFRRQPDLDPELMTCDVQLTSRLVDRTGTVVQVANISAAGPGFSQAQAFERAVENAARQLKDNMLNRIP